MNGRAIEEGDAAAGKPPAKRRRSAGELAPEGRGARADDARAQAAGRVEPLLEDVATYARTQPLGLKVLIERYHYFLRELAPACAESLLSIEDSIAQLKAKHVDAVAYHRSNDFLADWAFLVGPKARIVTRKRPPSDIEMVRGMTGETISNKLAAYANSLARRGAGNFDDAVPPLSPSAHKFLGQRLDPRGTGEAMAKREKASQSIKARVKTLQMGRLDSETLNRLRARSTHAAQALNDSFGRGRESRWAFIPLEASPYAVFAAGGEGSLLPRRSPTLIKSLSDGEGVKAASNSLIPKAKPKSKQKGAAKTKGGKGSKGPQRGKGQAAEQKQYAAEKSNLEVKRRRSDDSERDSSLEMDEDNDRPDDRDDDALSDHWSDLDEDKLFEEDEWERSNTTVSGSAAAAALAGGLGLTLPLGLSNHPTWVPRICLTPRAHAAAEIIRVMIDDPRWQEKDKGNQNRKGTGHGTEEIRRDGPGLTILGSWARFTSPIA